MNKELVNALIDKSHFKTFDKVEKVVKQKYPEITSKELRQILRDRAKDRHLKLMQTKPYMIKIFSTMPKCWFHDLLDNGKENNPRYWHVFIGTNNRFAVVKPLMSKSASAIRATLAEFINEEHPVKLTSDEEPAFMEKSNVELCTKNKVSIYIVTEKNHSSLGIIDRFIRTLRDMNTPTDGGKSESISPKHQMFSIERMKKFINIYNNTYHSTIGCSPKEMKDDQNKEKEYIFKCLDKKEKQETIKNFELKEGMFVRYTMPRSDGIKKKRYQMSKECFKIDGKDGKMYTLIARDGTVKTLPRYRLIVCDPTKESGKIKWGQTFENNWNGVITEIMEYDKGRNKYKVRFKVPNKEDYIDWIPPSNLRGNTPQRVSEIEKQFGYN